MSILKSILAEQMLTIVLTDVTTRFRSRCAKLCILLGAENKRAASKIVDSAFFQRWSNVPSPQKEALKRVLPENPTKDSTFYDIKASPGRYLEATLKLCREMGEEKCKFSFCPTRSTCVPCNAKFDTESIVQLMLLHRGEKEIGQRGKSRLLHWVWNHFLDRGKVDSKLRKLRFHHEMTEFPHLCYILGRFSLSLNQADHSPLTKKMSQWILSLAAKNVTLGDKLE